MRSDDLIAPTIAIVLAGFVVLIGSAQQHDGCLSKYPAELTKRRDKIIFV
jgi:hypothetical protein